MDARIEDLIQAELDGALSAGEKAELEAGVAASPESARLQQALAGLVAAFAAAEPVDPPASLVEAISRSITLPQPAVAAVELPQETVSDFIKSASVTSTFFNSKGSKTMAWSNSKKWVLGACSVPLVVVLGMAAQKFSVDGSQVSGTIAPAERHVASQVSGDGLDAAPASAEGSSTGGEKPAVDSKDLREGAASLKKNKAKVGKAKKNKAKKNKSKGK